MAKKFDKSAFKNAIKVLVTPWEKVLPVELLWILILNSPQKNMNYVLQ